MNIYEVDFDNVALAIITFSFLIYIWGVEDKDKVIKGIGMFWVVIGSIFNLLDLYGVLK